MAKPEIDWTIADAPPADEAAPAAAGRPPTVPPGRVHPRPLWRRLGLGVVLGLALAGVLAAGYWVVVWRGEQQVRAQITAEVVYEDARSLARETELALGVWADPDLAYVAALTEWRERRAEEIGLGLAAPLPLAGLTPVAAAPEVTAVQVQPDNPNVWEATVVRTYVDAAGRMVRFALAQRYQNVGPGLWQRLPPNTAAPADTTLVTGFRLSVTLPVADLPWLSDSLFAADAALVQACADWGAQACGDHRLDVVFVTDLAARLQVGAAAPGLAAGYGPYPLAFDLAPRTPRTPSGPAPLRLLSPSGPAPLRLLSPHLAGWPVDEAARAALTRALTVYGLSALAAAQAGPPSGPESDYFFTALVARAELRLGLALPLTYTLQAADYVPVNRLWQAATDEVAPAVASALPLQVQALQFLEAALAEQPPSTDAALLAGLRRWQGLAAWLGGALTRSGAAEAVAAWDAQAAQQLAAAGPPALTDLEGLSYRCDNLTYLVQGGAARRLPVGTPWPGLGVPSLARAPDGRTLAAVTASPAGPVTLTLHDLNGGGEPVVVDTAAEIFLIGWSQGGTLLYVKLPGTTEPPEARAEDYRLWGYDPARPPSAPLIEASLAPWFTNMGAWLPDRRSLVVNLVQPAIGDFPLGYAPAWVAVDEPGAVPRQLAPQGFPSALAPDGQWVAYAVATPSETGATFELGMIEARTVAGDERRTLLRLDDWRARDSAAAAMQNILPLGWLGNSAGLLILAAGGDNATGMYLLAADGSGALVALPRTTGYLGSFLAVAHSADGRYLSYHLYDVAPVVALTVLDAEAAPGAGLARTLALDAGAAAWSPTGARLAVAGAAGLRVADLTTGQTHWVTAGACDAVHWFAP